MDNHGIVRTYIRYSIAFMLLSMHFALASIVADATNTSVYASVAVLGVISASMLLCTALVTIKKEYLVSGIAIALLSMNAYWIGGYSFVIPFSLLFKFGVGHISMILLAEHCIAEDRRSRRQAGIYMRSYIG